MTVTLSMIRRIREIQNGRLQTQSSHPTRFDIRLGQLLSYLNHRHYRETGHLPPYQYTR